MICLSHSICVEGNPGAKVGVLGFSPAMIKSRFGATRIVDCGHHGVRQEPSIEIIDQVLPLVI